MASRRSGLLLKCLLACIVLGSALAGFGETTYVSAAHFLQEPRAEFYGDWFTPTRDLDHPSPNFSTQDAPLLTPSPLVEEMISRVTISDLVTYMGDLTGEWEVDIGGEPFLIASRYSFSGIFIQMAAQYLHEFYQDLGMPVAYQPFSLNKEGEPHELSNVIAEKKGSIFPDRVFIIGGHYDSLPDEDIAPGADDNASGTVGVMLAAKILQDYDFGCTLRFAHFAAEEQGLFGSEHYARQAYCSAEDVRGFINLDMIAWNTPGSSPDMDIHANQNVPGSLELAELYKQVIQIYNLNLVPEIHPNGTNRSDHGRFWAYDIPAILAIEDFLHDFNPNYHQKTDTLSELQDLDYYAEMVKAGLAAMAHLGCLVEDGRGNVSGTISDEENDLPVASATLSFTHPDWDYTIITTSSETGQFDLSLVSGAHTLVVDAAGYAPLALTEILVEPDAIITLDLSLAPVDEVLHYLPILLRPPAEVPEGCP
jgi:hypothetical protein